MGSLEQQMALFEELISQDQTPTNGILMPAQPSLVSIPPGAFVGQPVVVSRPVGIISSSAYSSAVANSLANSLANRTAQTITVTPPISSIPMPPGEMMHPRQIPQRQIPQRPAPPPQNKPSPKKQKTGPPPLPSLPEGSSDALKAAIAKAAAAANATNTRNYALPKLGEDGFAVAGQYKTPPKYPPAPGVGGPGPMSGAPLPGPGPSRQQQPPPPPPPPAHHMRPPPMPPMRPPNIPPPAPYHRPQPPPPLPNPKEVLAQAKMAGKEIKKKKMKSKDKKVMRTAAGDVWDDPSLLEWEDNDFRIFVGDLGNECNDEMLYRAFSKYPSLLKVKVVRDKRSNKTKGFGFVSFKESSDYIKAMREVNGKYIGNRPCKLRKSSWKDRQYTVVKKKNAEKQRLGLKI